MGKIDLGQITQNLWHSDHSTNGNKTNPNVSFSRASKDL